MMVFVVFALLSSMTLLNAKMRAGAFSRTSQEWLIDGISLFLQGFAIPLLQVLVVVQLLGALLPNDAHRLDLGPVGCFFLNFAFVDYIYYWNHRLLHKKKLWRWHAVHHSATHLDVWVTSRNSALSHLLILYWWLNGLCLFLLKDPTWFIASASITASLDLWRHTSYTDSRLRRLLAYIFITPNEHAWHHSSFRSNVNFGANLSIWDRLHGTYYAAEAAPRSLGIPVKLGFLQKFLWPFAKRRA